MEPTPARRIEVRPLDVARRASSTEMIVSRPCAHSSSSSSVPALAWAQAEPAPPGYVPPGQHEPEPPPPSPCSWHIAVNARLAVPLGTIPPNLAPVGYGGGIQITRALIDFGRMRLGVGTDFAYQRIPHSTDEFLSR